MNVLVTGNNGYIGSMLCDLLQKKGHSVIGFDTNYYEKCEFESSRNSLHQIIGDIRTISKHDLINVDSIIHLAALSNDPLGAFNPELTSEINYAATVRFAKLAKEMGICRFLYASSCSLYGVSGDQALTENVPFSPITAYAISKAKSEEGLSKLADNLFSPVYLRAATVYGIAPLLRTDIVLNNLVGWAFTTGKIKIMSDGTPWRPAVHVEDVSKAYIACLEAPLDLIHNEAFNVGQNKENYQIKTMANVVKKIVPGCEIEYTGMHGKDSRTYIVNFDKISTILAEYFKPTWDIEKGTRQLYEAYKAHGLTYEDFVGSKYIRIKRLKELVDQKLLDSNLSWKNADDCH
jgi:nucleoside-diphosphate-sugar epimerase